MQTMMPPRSERWLAAATVAPIPTVRRQWPSSGVAALILVPIPDLYGELRDLYPKLRDLWGDLARCGGRGALSFRRPCRRRVIIARRATQTEGTWERTSKNANQQ
jgi:hypothetical protein